MRYVLLLSTSSGRNLAAHNSELVHFTRDVPSSPEVDLLRFRNKWYVGSKSGCSCTFRHLYSVELGFGAPADWYPEGADEIAATKAVIAIMRELVDSGEGVDCIDTWESHDARPVTAAELEVDLTSVGNDEFRFFEGYHFVFKLGTPWGAHAGAD